MPEDNQLELLREMLNRRPRYNDPLNEAPEGLPQVPPAPIFRPDPQVIGGKRLQLAVQNLLKVAPEMRGRTSTVSAAPTSSAIQTAMASGLSPSLLPVSTLLGQRDPSDNSIWINPLYEDGLMTDPMETTLAHEFGHAAGHRHGPEIDQIEELAKALIPQTIR